MSRRVKIINIIICCAWIALISVLLYKNYSGTALEKSQIMRESFNKESYWYDIYIGSKKIGFATTSFKKAGNEIIIKDEREMKVKKNGEDKLLIERLNCLTDLYYSIKSFEYSSNFKGEQGIKVTGEVEEENIIFFLESPGKRKTFKTPSRGRDFYLPVTLIPSIYGKKLVLNEIFSISMLNFMSLSTDDVKVVLEEIRPIKLGINILSLYKYRIGNTIIWSNEKGRIIKEEYPNGLTLYSQAESIANDPADRIIFDYTSVPFLKSNKFIPDTEKLNLLKVKVKGFRMDPQIYENSPISLKDDILTINKVDIEDIKRKTYTLPFKDDKLKMYLKTDDWILSDDKTVKGNAHNMAVIEKNSAFLLARFLNSNLYFMVNPMPMFVLSNSLDVFKSHLGDYLERTVMFSSFARAAGMPTRMVSGIVYRDRYFYFHTWPEVWLEKWIPVDPTLAQFPADVTHIPLKDGDLKTITSIIRDLENLNIEILEAS